MRRFITAAYCLAAAIILLRLGNAYFLPQPFELPVLQLGFFLLVVLVGIVFLPPYYLRQRIIIAGIGVLATALALNIQMHFFRPHGTVFFARLTGDIEDATTREFMQWVSKAAVAAGSNVYLQQHFASITNGSGADQVMHRFKTAHALVYGSKRWLSVAVQPNLPDGFDVPLINLKQSARLITYVPGFGMSADPLNATATFLGVFFGALEASNYAEKLRLLDAAASLKAGWTLYGHVAYVRWLEATILLQQALRVSPIEVPELRCALNKLIEAQKFLRLKDNPPLLTAIVNNKAIVATLLYLSQNQDVLTPSSQLEELRRIHSIRESIGTGRVANQILKAVDQTRKALRVTQAKRVKRNKSSLKDSPK